MLLLLDSPIIAWISIICITALYIPLNKRPAISYIVSRWDHKIPFIPSWVYAYTLYYPLVCISCLLLPLHKTLGLPFTISYLVGSCIAVSIWFMFPTGVKRPKLTQRVRIDHKILHHLFTHDGDTNAVPSGHVLHTVICAYYVALAFPHFAVVAYTCAGLITLSTVLVKQHYLFDIPTGVLVGIVSILAGRTLIV